MRGREMMNRTGEFKHGRASGLAIYYEKSVYVTYVVDDDKTLLLNHKSNYDSPILSCTRMYPAVVRRLRNPFFINKITNRFKISMAMMYSAYYN